MKWINFLKLDEINSGKEILMKIFMHFIFLFVWFGAFHVFPRTEKRDMICITLLHPLEFHSSRMELHFPTKCNKTHMLWKAATFHILRTLMSFKGRLKACSQMKCFPSEKYIHYEYNFDSWDYTELSMMWMSTWERIGKKKTSRWAWL